MKRPLQFKPKAKTSAKSNRQRRKELDAKRAAKRTKEEQLRDAAARAAAIKGKVLVNVELLRPTGSYDRPGFVQRGYYEDEPYTCRDCGSKEIWRATQQKWWYEVAKGDVWTRAGRCLPCRRRLRAQQEAERLAQ